ncbi:MAG: Spi family protease inhibitor, partial [Bacteroidales bacterium]|nr:Spi family protease inhibitor [Bacteroidales bacterium]
MKKFCIIIGISLWQMWAFAAHVPVGKAQTVGQHFLSQQSQFSGILPVQLNLQLVYTEGVKDNNQKSNEDGITYFYVFNAGNQGFVIVAGDDRVLPILGYADKGSFDPENIPINCKKWLEGYKNEIRYVVENEIIATEEIEQKWSDYYDNVKQKQRKGAVAPLLTTTW